MELSYRYTGWKELDAFLQDLAMTVVKPPGMARAFEAGAQYIAEGVKDNIWALFDTEGDFPDGVTVVIVNQYSTEIRVERVYAAVHEYGGTFTVSEAQRGFFWAQWYQTGDGMWKALALSDSYTIPARPYFRPAVIERAKGAIMVVGDYVGDVILSVAAAHGG